jgi:hypothetical protein
MTPSERHRAEILELTKRGVEASQRAGSRLSTWLVVGNVGGLVLTFNAIVQGSTCDLASLRRAAMGFASGAGLAALAVASSYVNIILLTVSTRDLLTPPAERKRPPRTARPHWYAAVAAWLLLVASFASLSATVLTPLLGNDVALKTCAAKGRATAIEGQVGGSSVRR